MRFGPGLYGEKNTSVSFTIGPKRVAIADANTKHMLCYVDDQLVRDIPVSMGKGGYAMQDGQKIIGFDGQPIDFWTHNGTYIVLEHKDEVRMASSTYNVTDPTNPNFYDELVKLAVKISYSGIYVHLADWNIPKHGHINSSHGCINVGPTNAKWFFDTFQMGDVVQVKNSNIELAFYDGVADWTTTWDKWIAPQG
jgi:lipoprotein-anchoring transpeptidase ErfK/SrfK